MTEEWRSVPGWDGLYEVSDFGRVRSLDRIVTQGGPHGKPMERVQHGRVMRTSTDRDGYHQLILRDAPRVRRYFVHQLVLLAFVGPCLEGHVGDHRFGDRDDNRLSELRWLDYPDNARNKHKARGQSGVVGVSKSSKRSIHPWMAMVRLRGGGRQYLGSFATVEEARTVYEAHRDRQFA